MTAVTVTARHLAGNVPASCTDCAVALALRDAFPDAEIWVGGAEFEITFRDREPVLVDLPGDVEESIHALDDGYRIEPFTFTVDYPAATP